MEAKPVDEDMRSLQSLLDDGVITESEFTEKKRQLLDQSALPATCAAPPGETPPPPKKIKAAPPAAPPTAPPANEPSLQLGYYELRDAGDDVIGFLVLSVWTVGVVAVRRRGLVTCQRSCLCRPAYRRRLSLPHGC